MSVAARALERAVRLPLDELLAGDVVTAAAALVGCAIERRLPGGEVRAGLLVECEAYHMREPGSHSFRGKTPRNSTMFGPPGRLYVYFTYGMWHCANVVCEAEGTGAGVLMRAAQPLKPDDGADGRPPLRLSGPGLLCQGLSLDRGDNGAELLTGGPIRLYRPPDFRLPPLQWTRRVGLGIDEELRWRVCWAGHPALSRGKPGPTPKGRGKLPDQSTRG